MGVIVLTITAMVIAFATALLVDPFNVWHTVTTDRYVTSDPRISKRAIARDSRYDSFIVGTSLSQEFDVLALNAALGAKFADLTMGGATSYEMLNVIEFLPQTDYRYLILEVYFASYSGGEMDTRKDDYPDYLWDNSVSNDVLVYLDAVERKQLVAETLGAIKVNILGRAKS